MSDLAASFDLQAGWCARMDSPLYAALIGIAADDIRHGGDIAQIVADFPLEPVDAALALRFMGGIHRLVLMGLAPDLAAHFPNVGGVPDVESVREPFLAAAAAHRGYLIDALAIAPQTNEIGRSAALFPATLATMGGRPIRLLELGSAAGLNLLPDRYRYEADQWAWGDPASAAVVRSALRGADPPVPPSATVEIVERRGCDVAPIDVTDPDQELRLLSFVWPEHAERFARIRGAVAIARAGPPHVDRGDAASWLSVQLAAEPTHQTGTVVQHSTVWQYFPEATRTGVLEAIAAAGALATEDAPLAHVRFEPGDHPGGKAGFVITATRWPGGADRVLGTGHAHGNWIDWDG